MAKEHGIDLTGVTGTGSGGRISKQDIEAIISGGGQHAGGAVEHADESGQVEEELEEAFNEPAPTRQAPSMPPPAARTAPPPPSSAGQHGGQVHAAFESAVPREKIYFGDYEVTPMTMMRQRIGEHMVASKRVSAHVYSVDEIDMSKVAALRAKSKDEFEKRNGTKLTFMPFFVKAAVAGLRAYPTLNSSLDGTNVVMHKEINIGIAVALDWGLIVPVIKHADELSLMGIARAINDLGERARTKKLLPDDIQRGTFTITNPGGFGPFAGIPIINQPQVAILGVGAIEKRPKVVTAADGTDSIAIRTMGMLTMSYDHRVVDGADADKFLADVKQLLQEFPEGAV